MLARNRRRGFTLFEVVLVCAVMVLLAAISYPSLRGMYPYHKLNGAVDSVRAAWAYARSRAIEEGRPYRFAIDEAGTHVRVAPDREDYWSGGSGPADDPDGKGLIYEQGVSAGVVLSINDSAAPPPPDDQSTRDEKAPSSGNWTSAAVFLPDGTAKQNLRVLFQIKGSRSIALQLRGLTGTVSVQSVNP